MKHFGLRSALLFGSTGVLAASMALTGCRNSEHPDDRLAVYNALDQHYLRSLTVSQDRDSGVITLSGIVGSNDRKQRAVQIAQQAAPGYQIVDRMQVDSTGLQSEINSETADSQLNSAIEDHFKASVAAHRALRTQKIQCTAANGTLTLKGTVKTAQEKKEAEELAKKVPQVQHVVNEIQVHPGKPSPANPSNAG